MTPPQLPSNDTLELIAEKVARPTAQVRELPSHLAVQASSSVMRRH